MLTRLLPALAALCLLGAGPVTPAVNAPLVLLDNLTARAVDLRTATPPADVATIALPSYVTAYAATAIEVSNCDAVPVLAQVAIYNGAGGTGTNLAAAATITGATTASVVLPLTLATTARQTVSSPPGNIYVRLIVANVAALHCDFRISVRDWT